MKPANNELYELIYSLTPLEQKDFLAYSKAKSGNDSSDYLKLYTVYIKTKKLKEIEIEEKANFKNPVRIKNYLYNQILEYLSHKTIETTEQEICKMLVLSNTLVSRSLYKQALTILNKALIKANEMELFSYSFIIDEKITRIHLNNNNVDFMEVYINDSTFPYLEKVVNEAEINKNITKLRVSEIRHNGIYRTPEAIAEFESLINLFISKGDNYPKTFRGRLSYNQALAVYYQNAGKLELALEYHKWNFDLFENNDIIKQEELIKYLIILNNVLAGYYFLKKWEELQFYLEKVRSFAPIKGNHTPFVIQTYSIFQCYYLVYHANDPNKAAKLTQIENDFEAYENQIGLQYRIAIIVNVSINHFMDSNFKAALEWVNKLDKYEKQSALTETISIAKLYKLIIYFEMNKIDLLESSILNTYRFLNKKNKYYEFEKLFFSSLRKLLKVDTKTEQELIYRSTLEEFLELEKDSLNQKIFEAFNFIGWLKCKISGNNFKNLMN